MSINWSTVQTALVNWVKTATGYPTGRVFFRDQNGMKPRADFATIKVLGLARVGQDESRSVFDAGDVGTEFEHFAEGTRELSVSIQVHTSAVIGSAMALAMASKIQTALRLDSIRSALVAAGLGPVDAGNVLDLSALVDAGFEGRATVTCRFYITEQVSDFSTFIETVNTTPYWGDPDEGEEDTIDI